MLRIELNAAEACCWTGGSNSNPALGAGNRVMCPHERELVVVIWGLTSPAEAGFMAEMDFSLGTFGELMIFKVKTTCLI